MDQLAEVDVGAMILAHDLLEDLREHVVPVFKQDRAVFVEKERDQRWQVFAEERLRCPFFEYFDVGSHGELLHWTVGQRRKPVHLWHSYTTRKHLCEVVYAPYFGAPTFSISIVMSSKSLSCVTLAEPARTSSSIARKYTMTSCFSRVFTSSLKRVLKAVVRRFLRLMMTSSSASMGATD